MFCCFAMRWIACDEGTLYGVGGGVGGVGGVGGGGGRGCAGGDGHGGARAVHVQLHRPRVFAIHPTLAFRNFQRLKLKYDESLSNVAFNFNLRLYTLGHKIDRLCVFDFDDTIKVSGVNWVNGAGSIRIESKRLVSVVVQVEPAGVSGVESTRFQGVLR